MGKIIRVLGSKKIKGQPERLASRLITEDNRKEKTVHIHLRNMRLNMSENEFKEFSSHLLKSMDKYAKGKGVNKDDGRDGFKDSYFVLDEQKIKEKPDLDQNKFQVELNKPGIIHIHYRNFRLDLSLKEFEELTEIVNLANKNLKEYLKSKS
jgi:hypothetical protein